VPPNKLQFVWFQVLLYFLFTISRHRKKIQVFFQSLILFIVSFIFFSTNYFKKFWSVGLVKIDNESQGDDPCNLGNPFGSL